MLLLCRDAALRIGTAERVAAQHIDQRKWILRIDTKRGAQAEVPLTARLREMVAFTIRMAASPSLPLYVALGGTVVQGAAHLSEPLAELRAEAGCSHWTWHDLRRTAARALYDRTHDLRLVQGLLAHKSLAQTLWYLQDVRLLPTAELLERERKEA